MSVPVRRLESRDRAAWLVLFRDYIAFYEASVGEDVIAATWRRLFAEDCLMALVAVDAADVPIGIAHLLFHRSTWSPTWYCYLEDLFVAPARRKQGIGRALIEAVFREADARAATRTYWMTQEHNHVARALYDRLAMRAPFVQYRRSK